MYTKNITEFNLIKKVHLMALRGFNTTVISIEAGIQTRKIKTILSLIDHKLYDELKKNKIRSIQNILNNSENVINSTLLISFYQRIFPGYLNQICISSLITSFEMLEKDVQIDNSSTSKLTVSITDAWILAREIRQKNLFLYRCPNCNSMYLYSIDLSKKLNHCPFCILHRYS